jgi:nitrile hydratase
VRTPWYIRGRTGEVERLCGAFANPEELAYNRDGLPRQPLYRVRFRQREVWPDYGGSERDTIDVEIYQHWLEEAR